MAKDEDDEDEEEKAKKPKNLRDVYKKSRALMRENQDTAARIMARKTQEENAEEEAKQK